MNIREALLIMNPGKAWGLQDDLNDLETSFLTFGYVTENAKYTASPGPFSQSEFEATL